MTPPSPPHPSILLVRRPLTPRPQVHFGLDGSLKFRRYRFLYQGIRVRRGRRRRGGVDEVVEWDGEGVEEVKVEEGRGEGVQSVEP